MKFEPFETRRISDPQGVIDDLVAQIARQANTICEQAKLIEQLQDKKEPLFKTKQSG
jgi:hypothetical protein